MGTDIAVQVRDYLKGGVIQQAVNFFSLSGDLYDQVRPAMDLAERLGLFLGQVCRGSLERIELGVYGDLREVDLKPILSAAVNGVLRPVLAEGVTLVNALAIAQDRKIEVLESTSSASVAFANLIALRLKTSEDDLSVAGTLFGRNHLRLVDVDGVEVDTIPQGNILLVKNDDTPGHRGQGGNAARRPGHEHRAHGAGPQAGERPGDHAHRDRQRGAARGSWTSCPRSPGIREARFLKLG